MRSSRSRSRRSCARAKTLGYLPARSTASRPTRTTATIPRAWRPHSACRSCASPTCSGAGAEAAARPRSATPPRRSRRGWPTVSSSSARSLKDSSRASVWVGRRRLSRASRPSRFPTGSCHRGSATPCASRASCTSTVWDASPSARSRWPRTTTRRRIRAP